MKAAIRIVRAAALAGIDDNDCVAGYQTGYKGEPAPAGASFSFMHGHRNGMIDSRRIEPDQEAAALARDCIASGYFKNLFNPSQETV